MDERIEKLALAVKAWFPDGYPSAEGDNEYWENLVIFEKAQLEKFVELIVKECLEACSRANEIRHFVQPLKQQVVLDCMLEIEKAFRS